MLDRKVGTQRVLCAAKAKALATNPYGVELLGVPVAVVHQLRPGDLLVLVPTSYFVVLAEERRELAETIGPPPARAVGTPVEDVDPGPGKKGAAASMPSATRCPLACPHGYRCRLEAGHELQVFPGTDIQVGCSHLPPPEGCDCNEPNRRPT